MIQMSPDTCYLPTTDRLDVPIPPDLDVPNVARTWLAEFARAVEAKDIPGVLGCIHPDGWWRDLFALTWDMRTFHGEAKIQVFLQDRLVGAFSEVQFRVNPEGMTEEASLQTPYPDLQWLRVHFPFHTRVAEGRVVAYLIPTSPPSTWKAFILTTHLESLTSHPERVGSLRTFVPDHGGREDSRRDRPVEDQDPEVVIIGAGHAGLGLAARLGCLGVRALVVEKNERVGDGWRGRYEALCLHDVLCE